MRDGNYRQKMGGWMDGVWKAYQSIFIVGSILAFSVFSSLLKEHQPAEGMAMGA